MCIRDSYLENNLFYCAAVYANTRNKIQVSANLQRQVLLSEATHEQDTRAGRAPGRAPGPGILARHPAGHPVSAIHEQLQASDPSCSCGAPLQTMSHIANDCPDTYFPGGLSALHLADEEAIAWLGMESTR